MDKSREQFEAAIKQKYGDLIDQRVCKNGDGEYMAWDMQVAWWAWQESRRAIAVNLGRPIYVKHNGDYIHAWPAYNVDIAIRAAGLKVKGE
ncbi:hypothetical protein SM086_004106 [Cronobacter sakazakii]|nr:hypothetical protein [Cronobacter sakazakii]